MFASFFLYEKELMNDQYGKVDGDIEIASELRMHGMFSGRVVVKSGGNLILHGMAGKDLIVELGAVVEISGMVVGNVINNGGKISVMGTIVGKIIENSGETLISSNASVG